MNIFSQGWALSFTAALVCIALAGCGGGNGAPGDDPGGGGGHPTPSASAAYFLAPKGSFVLLTGPEKLDGSGDPLPSDAPPNRVLLIDAEGEMMPAQLKMTDGTLQPIPIVSGSQDSLPPTFAYENLSDEFGALFTNLSSSVGLAAGGIFIHRKHDGALLGLTNLSDHAVRSDSPLGSSRAERLVPVLRPINGSPEYFYLSSNDERSLLRVPLHALRAAAAGTRVATEIVARDSSFRIPRFGLVDEDAGRIYLNRTGIVSLDGTLLHAYEPSSFLFRVGSRGYVQGSGQYRRCPEDIAEPATDLVGFVRADSADVVPLTVPGPASCPDGAPEQAKLKSLRAAPTAERYFTLHADRLYEVRDGSVEEIPIFHEQLPGADLYTDAIADCSDVVCIANNGVRAFSFPADGAGIVRDIGLQSGLPASVYQAGGLFFILGEALTVLRATEASSQILHTYTLPTQAFGLSPFAVE